MASRASNSAILGSTFGGAGGVGAGAAGVVSAGLVAAGLSAGGVVPPPRPIMGDGLRLFAFAAGGGGRRRLLSAAASSAVSLRTWSLLMKPVAPVGAAMT